MQAICSFAQNARVSNAVRFTLSNLHPLGGRAGIKLRSQSLHAESREDNGVMNKERDLLPWILSGLLMATIAIAITAGSTLGIASKNLRAHNAAVEPAMPAPADPPPAQPAAIPAVLPSPADEQVPTAPPPSEPTGKIWECTTNGLRTFSNNPCGDKSSLREVGPINTMNATPPVRSVHAYGPRYAPGYAEEGANPDQDTYSDQAASELGGESYTVLQRFAYLPRKRPEHPHPPYHHNPGMLLRKN
jgi:hypothetical protein